MEAEETRLVPKTAQEAVQQVVMANRILSNECLLDALGHVSVRNPENNNTFFQARSLSPLEVTQGDILEIDLDGLTGGTLYDRHLVDALSARGHQVEICALPRRSWATGLLDNLLPGPAARCSGQTLSGWLLLSRFCRKSRKRW